MEPRRPRTRNNHTDQWRDDNSQLVSLSERREKDYIKKLEPVQLIFNTYHSETTKKDMLKFGNTLLEALGPKNIQLESEYGNIKVKQRTRPRMSINYAVQTARTTFGRRRRIKQARGVPDSPESLEGHINVNSTDEGEYVHDNNNSTDPNDNILEEQVMDDPNHSPRQNVLIEARHGPATRSKCAVPVQSMGSTVEKRPKSTTRTKRGKKVNDVVCNPTEPVGGTRIDTSIPEASDLVPYTDVGHRNNTSLPSDSITETDEGPSGLNSEAAVSSYHINKNATSQHYSVNINDSISEDPMLDDHNDADRVIRYVVVTKQAAIQSKPVVPEARHGPATRSKCVVPVRSVRSTVEKRSKSTTRTKRGKKVNDVDCNPTEPVGGTRIDTSIPEASDLVPHTDVGHRNNTSLPSDSITETDEGPRGLNSEAAASSDHINKNATIQHLISVVPGEAPHTLNEVLSGIKEKKEKIKQLKNIILYDKALDLVNTLVINLAYQDLFLQFPSEDHCVKVKDLCDRISTACKDLFSIENGNLDPLQLSCTIQNYLENAVYLDMHGGLIFFKFSDCKQAEILAEINKCRTELSGLEVKKHKLAQASIGSCLE